MGAHFHLLDNNAFSTRIRGTAPSDVDRKQFKSPNLKSGMLERDIYPELGAVVQSVLTAAKCTKLRFLDTVNHNSKFKEGKHGSGTTDTFNNAGIYRNTGLVQDATDRGPEHLAKSQTSSERLLGAQSCFWVDVPVAVKSDEKNSAFNFSMKPERPLDESGHPAAVDSHGDEKIGDTGSHAGMQEAKEKDEVVWEVDQAKDDEDAKKEEEGGGREDAHSCDSEAGHTEKGVGDDGDDNSDDNGEFEVAEDDEDNSGAQPKHSKSWPDPVLSFLKKSYPPFVNISRDGIKALNQFFEHHLNIFQYQHRTFCYSIYICFDMARLLYFDHAGAYISHPFSWVEPTSLLHEFVWKFAQLANADKLGAMGHDTMATVVPAGTQQEFIERAKNPALPAHVREGLKKASESGCPLYELVVQDVAPSRDEWFPDEPFPEPPTPPSSRSESGDPSSGDATSPAIRRFIVGRPHFSADTLVGRCTKGYMAFDVTDPEKWVPCFIKDSWRPYVPNWTRPEHLIYERLKRRKLKATDGIATMICGGDVGGSRAQRTRVQKDLPDAGKQVLRVHYRIALEDIGLPLSEFDNFSELSGIFVGALRGHRKAWDLAGILHGDISVGNIMIRVLSDGTRDGFLIDWDLSRLACELPKGPVRPTRTGTRQFRSALSLQYPRKPYQRSDDVESFIHVYLYLVLRYHPTSVGRLKSTVRQLFDMSGGTGIGGSAKLLMLLSGYLGFIVPNNAYLQRLLHDILDHCRMAYEEIDCDAMKRLYGPSPQSGAAAERRMPPRSSKPRPKPSVLRASDYIGRPLASLDHRAERRRQREDARRAALAEPYEPEVGPFLSNPRMLMNLFIDHAESEAWEYQDKASDQFVCRTIEGAFWPSSAESEHGKFGGISIPSVTWSAKAGGDGPSVRPSDVSTAADAGLSPGSTVTSKKRKYAEEQGEEDEGNEEDEGQGSAVHCTKRTKHRAGKVSAGQGSDST